MVEKIRSINPFTGDVMNEFQLLSPKQINDEIALSRKACSVWKTTPVEERTRYIKRLAGQLRAAKRTYAELMTKEMGKPIRESLAEIEKCALLCDYYSEAAPHFLEKEYIKTEAVNLLNVFSDRGGFILSSGCEIPPESKPENIAAMVDATRNG